MKRRKDVEAGLRGWAVEQAIKARANAGAVNDGAQEIIEMASDIYDFINTRRG
jgi:hypothetical protein